MAAKMYIQDAINALQRALQDMRAQMDALRGQTDQQKRQLQQEIDHRSAEQKVDELALVEAADNAARAVIAVRMEANHHAVEDARNRMARLDMELGHVVQPKTAAHNELQRIMERLSQFLSKPEIG